MSVQVLTSLQSQNRLSIRLSQRKVESAHATSLITDALAAYIPWDIVPAVIYYADTPTLKALSLVSRDFLFETAPYLCSLFVLKIAPGHPFPHSHVLSASEVIRTHTRARYITSLSTVVQDGPPLVGVSTHSSIDLAYSQPGSVAPLSRTSPPHSIFETLSSFFTSLTYLSSLHTLEFNISSHSHRYAFAISLTNHCASLPPSIRTLRILSFGPISPSFGESFWAKVGPRLITLDLRCPEGPMCVFPGFSFISRDNLRSLVELRVADTTFLRSFTMPKTLKTLSVGPMKGQCDLDWLRDAIVKGAKDCSIENLRLEWKHFDVEPLYACFKDISRDIYMSSKRICTSISAISLTHTDFASSDSLSRCLSHLLASFPSLDTFEWCHPNVSCQPLSIPINPPLPASTIEEVSNGYRVRIRESIRDRAHEVACEVDSQVSQCTLERRRAVLSGEASSSYTAPFSCLSRLALRSAEEYVELVRNEVSGEWIGCVALGSIHSI